MFFGILFTIIGTVGVLAAIYNVLNTEYRRKIDTRAKGKVVEIVKVRKKFQNRVSRYPKVEFIDQNGQKQEFLARNYLWLRKGKEVTVLYNPKNPQDPLLDLGKNRISHYIGTLIIAITFLAVGMLFLTGKIG